MMTWMAFGIGALWVAGVRKLLAEAALASRMWTRWRRSVYPAQVRDSEAALRSAIVLSFLAAAWTGAAVALVLFLKTSLE